MARQSVVAAASWGVAIAAFALVHGFRCAFVCLAAASAAAAITGLLRMNIWNETIPAEFRGRLAGVEMIRYLSGRPLLADATAGWIASRRDF